jgi:hypothetical protein
MSKKGSTNRSWIRLWVNSLMLIKLLWRQMLDPHVLSTPVEAADRRTVHNNGWNRANGMASTTWNPCV